MRLQTPIRGAALRTARAPHRAYLSGLFSITAVGRMACKSQRMISESPSETSAAQTRRRRVDGSLWCMSCDGQCQEYDSEGLWGTWLLYPAMEKVGGMRQLERLASRCPGEHLKVNRGSRARFCRRLVARLESIPVASDDAVRFLTTRCAIAWGEGESCDFRHQAVLDYACLPC